MYIPHGTYIDPADVDVTIVDTFQPALQPLGTSDVHTLLQLDCFGGRGLTERQFLKLIVKCRLCRRYVTRNTVRWHACEQVRAPIGDVNSSVGAPALVTFIDLTGGDD
jgi:hypothetical protein